MKKIIAFAMMAIFVFSLIPVAFAEEGTGTSVDSKTEIRIKEESRDDDTRVRNEIRIKEEVKDDKAEARVETRTKGEIRVRSVDRLKNLRQEHRVKIEGLSRERFDKISNLSSERLEKIAELDKRQIEHLAGLNIKNLEKIAELKKERLERISNLSEEKLERLSELEKEKLEKIADLNEAEIEKVSALNRARMKELAKLGHERLKLELKAVHIIKVKNADDLNRRDISESRLVQFRERFENAKDEFDEAKDELKEARERLKIAKEKRDDNATLEEAKDYLLHSADALISHLEKIKAKVQESKNIGNNTEARIVAEIDAQIAEINQIKADVQASTTKDQVKEAAKKLQDKWKRLKHLIRLHAERVVSARVEGIVNQGLVMEKRLDNVLAKAKEKGIEINVTADVSAFSEKIAVAKDKYTQAQAKLNAVIELKAGNATEEQIKTAADEAKALLKESRDAIKEAHGILKVIVRKIKEAMPEADISSDVEVEIESAA
ncbi:hypothetical protein HYX08_05545 [Candidatus Woesearchaeota archaeon]|nr:hypothetical protein [Candidatus Woesearchaeota archaeon]